jgi:signal transduction histidine kinase/DNA-binding response OmpR family regulator/CHASE3 domain sensor protein
MSPPTFAGFMVAVISVVVIAVLSYDSLRNSARSAQSLTRTIEVLVQLQAVVASVTNAETGQRGFLLTGRETYLEPFATAREQLPSQLKMLRTLIEDDPAQLARLDRLQTAITDKMQELDKTVELKRSDQAAAAMGLLLAGRGKTDMDHIRVVIAEMEAYERQLIASRTQAWRQAATLAFAVTGGGSLLLLMLIAAAAAMTAHEFRTRQVETWLRAGQLGLSGRMQGDLALTVLAERILEHLAQVLGAQVGAMFIAEADGSLRRVAGHALGPSGTPQLVRAGEGLVGQAGRERRLLHVRDVPEHYLTIRSGTSQGAPAELLIAPAALDGQLQGVLELGFLGAVEPAKVELIERVTEAIAIALRAARDRSRLEDLLQETQQQAQELQSREEELRINNDELEEQGRSLRESRAQMESQQVELEAINTQLEEQTQLLERQKEELAFSHSELLQRSEELARANEYKSNFLANMSHELRTPLNSTLILAKLLADNRDGNLTEQQVKFAQTISSAGKDLLALINDVLDLSRIEAGKVDLQLESVPLADTIDSVAGIFQQAAEQKKLAFTTRIEPGVPARIETDATRLAQILRNLLSNALKFTERGSITLRIYALGADSICFEVRDTGIGIEPQQQELIFEAFRQAEAGTHRKYGGTGLGLSISRDLARLLGGSLVLSSSPGAGSIFTLTLPLRAGLAAPERAATGARRTTGTVAATDEAAHRSAQERRAQRLAQDAVPDDRADLAPGRRLILIIEDDRSFALILRDLAHEQNFQVIIAHSANEGLICAAQFQPSAVLLDMNLPDHSGLGVLEQLKRNSQTRHIPVHVVSVADYRREALELGAVGYALKPVMREELVEALERLERRLSQSMRRVLVVEDDAHQRESVRGLLAAGNVEITAVETAAEALGHLSQSTFDCVVLDLNLPDLSGYDLLEKMAAREDVSFPPVVVHTARSLSREEEQRLRRYSDSIIIKDARSPERLLDEVTLFLHQVESRLPAEQQRMLTISRNRDETLEGRRVLIVEDDVRTVFALVSLLEPRGAAVEIARNGREALEALERSRSGAPIDLVLMDVMMPEMDGLAATREIRKQPQWARLPIIVLTAKAMRDDHRKCLEAGADDYVAKPLDVEKLLSLIRVWIAR